MNRKLLSLFGLKWNPFTSDIPIEGIVASENLQHFGWRLENLVMDGGFAIVTGPVGSGKSVALRWLAHKLSGIKDAHVASVTRPQSNLRDFYHELGDLFGLSLQTNNRFGSYRALREKWAQHIEATLLRPILFIDEAQEMLPAALSELRLMAARQFDSQAILTVVLCGDERLGEKFRTPDLLPLGSRIKTRLVLENKSRDELARTLEEATKMAGNHVLMTGGLITTLAERSMGNYRAMMQMANELLNVAARKEAAQIDEQMFFDTFNHYPKKKKILKD